jgi:hypothetical protein
MARHLSLGGLRPLAFAEADPGAAAVLVDAPIAVRSAWRSRPGCGWRWHGGRLRGTGEGPVVVADCDAAHCSLGDIVGQAEPTIVEQAGERLLADLSTGAPSTCNFFWRSAKSN